MTITTEISLCDFEAWSGAEYTMQTLWELNDVVNFDVFDTLEAMLTDCYYEGMDKTALNDFLWFENETIAEWLGFDNWEQLENKALGYEEEEEDEKEE